MASFLEWVAASRAHRVILLVMAIWLLNAFDLTQAYVPPVSLGGK